MYEFDNYVVIIDDSPLEKYKVSFRFLAAAVACQQRVEYDCGIPSYVYSLSPTQKD